MHAVRARVPVFFRWSWNQARERQEFAHHSKKEPLAGVRRSEAALHRPLCSSIRRIGLCSCEFSIQYKAMELADQPPPWLMAPQQE